MIVFWFETVLIQIFRSSNSKLEFFYWTHVARQRGSPKICTYFGGFLCEDRMVRRSLCEVRLVSKLTRLSVWRIQEALSGTRFEHLRTGHRFLSNFLVSQQCADWWSRTMSSNSFGLKSLFVHVFLAGVECAKFVWISIKRDQSAGCLIIASEPLPWHLWPSVVPLGPSLVAEPFCVVSHTLTLLGQKYPGERFD